jgi:rare lipoprotein A
MDAAIGSAHEAANAMASGNAALADWANAIDADHRDIRLALGIFADPQNAAALAQEFAVLGAVTEEPVSVGGRAATKLTMTRLKPGATKQDALNLAQELGLTDAILY